MKNSLNFMVRYATLEPLLEPLFMYFDHGILHFCPCLSVVLCK
jgi:hypothetical protein